MKSAKGDVSDEDEDVEDEEEEEEEEEEEDEFDEADEKDISTPSPTHTSPRTWVLSPCCVSLLTQCVVW